MLTYDYPGAKCAPSLLIGLINMFMMKSRNKGFCKENHCGGNDESVYPQCHLNYWYPGQVVMVYKFIVINEGICERK